MVCRFLCCVHFLLHLPISVLVRTYRTSFEVNETRVVKVEKILRVIIHIQIRCKSWNCPVMRVGEGLNFFIQILKIFLRKYLNILYLDVTCDPVVARISGFQRTPGSNTAHNQVDQKILGFSLYTPHFAHFTLSFQ